MEEQNLLDSIPEIKIEMDWDGVDGLYKEDRDEIMGEWCYSFKIYATSKRRLTPATHSFHEESDLIMQDVFIEDLKILYDNQQYVGDEFSDKVALEIEHNITITN